MATELAKRMVSGLAIGTLLLSGVSVLTAQERTVEKKTTRTETTTTRGGARLTKVLKSKVVLKEEGDGGRIVDFVLSDGGCVEYLVAEESDEYYLIPYSVATISYENQTIQVPVTRQQIRKEVRFTNDSWPDFSDKSYRTRIYSAWGVTSPRADSRSSEDRETRRSGAADRSADDERQSGDTKSKDSKNPKPREGKDEEGTETKSRDEKKPAAPKSNTEPKSPPRPETPNRPDAKPPVKPEPSTPPVKPAPKPEEKPPQSKNP